MTHEEIYIVLSIIVGLTWFFFSTFVIDGDIGISDLLLAGLIGLLLSIIWPILAGLIILYQPVRLARWLLR